MAVTLIEGFDLYNGVGDNIGFKTKWLPSSEAGHSLVAGRFGGQAYRYAYSAYLGEGVTFGPAMKHDLVRGITEVHDFGAGRATQEPVFVRRPGAAVEDEGWILSYVYDAESGLTDVVILDAQSFSAPPVAVIRLPVRVPFGFHGGWVPDLDGESNGA